MRIRAVLGFFASAALASGVSGLALAQGGPAKPARSNACFYARNVESFAPIDDTTVNVSVNGNQIYQLKTFSYCRDLAFSNDRIGLRSRGSSFVCAGQANALEIFTRSAAGGTRCSVSSVRKLSADEIAATPKRERP